MEMKDDKGDLFRVILSLPGCRDLGTRVCNRTVPQGCHCELQAQTQPRFGIGNTLRELWKMSKCCQEVPVLSALKGKN